MRRYDERVDVVMGRASGVDSEGAGAEAPEQFVWRNRRWRVLSVQRHWVEARPWWREFGETGSDELPDDGEDEVWRIEAATGQPGSCGVYELARPVGGIDWMLRGVID